jgi:hypothetical protein
VAFACTLREVSAECDASHTRGDVVRWDFSTHVCASSSWFRQLIDLDRMLEERHTLLCLQEMDLEVWEAILADELEHNLHPHDGQGLTVELDKAQAHMDRIDGESATEAERLSRQVM